MKNKKYMGIICGVAGVIIVSAVLLVCINMKSDKNKGEIKKVNNSIESTTETTHEIAKKETTTQEIETYTEPETEVKTEEETEEITTQIETVAQTEEVAIEQPVVETQQQIIEEPTIAEPITEAQPEPQPTQSVHTQEEPFTDPRRIIYEADSYKIEDLPELPEGYHWELFEYNSGSRYRAQCDVRTYFYYDENGEIDLINSYVVGSNGYNHHREDLRKFFEEIIKTTKIKNFCKKYSSTLAIGYFFSGSGDIYASTISYTLEDGDNTFYFKFDPSINDFVLKE